MPTHLVLHLFRVLAGPVPNPNPVNPVGGNGVSLILSYAKWGSLLACCIAALISGGEMAVGQLSHRPEYSDRGRRALLWSVAGVVVTAIAIPTLNTIFAAVH